MTASPDYTLIIPNKKTRTYDTMGWILYSLHIAGFIYLLIASPDDDHRKWAGFGIVLSVVFFSIEYFFGKKFKHFNGLQQSLNFLPFIWILRFRFWMIGVIAVFLSVLYNISKREFRVYISKDRIQLPTLFGSRYQWNELNNLILKDGLLTVDFKNNKLFQQLIDEDNPVDEAAFNAFCREQLAAHQ